MGAKRGAPVRRLRFLAPTARASLEGRPTGGSFGEFERSGRTPPRKVDTLRPDTWATRIGRVPVRGELVPGARARFELEILDADPRRRERKLRIYRRPRPGRTATGPSMRPAAGTPRPAPPSAAPPSPPPMTGDEADKLSSRSSPIEVRPPAVDAQLASPIPSYWAEGMVGAF